MASFSTSKFICLLFFFFLIIGIGILYVVSLKKTCHAGYFKQDDGQCYQLQPIYTCVNTNTPDSSGNEVYVISSFRQDFGCLAKQDGSGSGNNACLTYDNVTDCQTALNNPFAPTTGSPAYPNVSTTPSSSNIHVCAAADYTNTSSFCSYLNNKYISSNNS